VYPILKQVEDSVRFILVCRTLFLAITFTFIYFLFLAETYMVCVKVFYALRSEISVWSDKRHKLSPYTPIVKSIRFWQSRVYTWRCQKWAICTMGGLWVNLYFFVGSQLKFHFWLHIKRWPISCKVNFEITRNRKMLLQQIVKLSYKCQVFNGFTLQTILCSCQKQSCYM